ncbi:MAG: RHS repeat-associated core domain-containing protein [Anaerolineae bacterium]|nr:RHS repeat-associated core domain-containing protein [Anaerolineae bacterium]
MGKNDDCSLFDVYLDGTLWLSFDGYAATASDLTISIDVEGTGLHLLEVKNRLEHNVKSTGYKIRFKLLNAQPAFDVSTIDYGYDDISRLLEADYDMGTTVYSYGYDLSGNLTNNNGTSRTFNAANQMTNDGTNTMTYDDNSNLTKDGVNALTWDRANRMLTAPSSTSYKYDGLGNRIQQTVSSVVTDYLNDVQPGLTKLLRQADGTNTDFFVHGVRGIHAVDDGSAWKYAVQDGLRSVRGWADGNADVNNPVSYSPYGVPDTNVDGFAYTGEMRGKNGLQYHRARYYSPNMATWTAQDFLETDNRYGYVSGNVINRVDPTGLFNWCTGQIEQGDTLGTLYRVLVYQSGNLYGSNDFQRWNTVMSRLGQLNVGHPIYGQGIGNYNIGFFSNEPLDPNWDPIRIGDDMRAVAEVALGISCRPPAITTIDCPPDTITEPPIATPPAIIQPEFHGDCWDYCKQLHPIPEQAEAFVNCFESCSREHYSSCWDFDRLDELDVQSIGRIVGLDLYFIAGGGVSYLEMWDATGGDRHMRFLVVEGGLGISFDGGLVGAIVDKVAGKAISAVTSTVLGNIGGGGQEVWSEASMDEIAGWAAGYSVSLGIYGTSCSQGAGNDGEDNVTTTRGFSLGLGGNFSASYTFVLTDNHR